MTNDYIRGLETKSALTIKLKETALNLNKKGISPFIRIDFLHQIMIYLNFIENDLNIKIEN